MEKFFFMRPLLDRLAQARFFCRMVAIVLRVVAALFVLFSLTTFFKAGKIIFDLPTNGILGGVLFEIFFVVAVYAVAHVLLIRARDIDRLQPGEFYALSIGPILIKLLGEAYASFVSFTAIGGGLFVWFTSMKLDKLLNPIVRMLFPSTRDDPSFMGGIEFMFSGVLVAIAAVVVCYILAEALALLVRGTRNADSAHTLNGQPGYKSRFGS
jgi:hypothetical protein